MNLFEIKAEIESIIHDVVDEETGEIIGTEFDIEKLEMLQLEQSKKREYIAKLYKNYEADEAAYKKLKMEYDKKQKRAARIKDWAKNYLEIDLAGEAFESEDKAVKVSYRAVNNKVCVNWGIGRELYTAPFIWITKDCCNITNKNGKCTTYDRFDVKEIEYTDGVISRLVITNRNIKRDVFTYGRPSDARVEAMITAELLGQIQAELIRTGVPEKAVVDTYKKERLEFLTKIEAENALKRLKKSASKSKE